MGMQKLNMGVHKAIFENALSPFFKKKYQNQMYNKLIYLFNLHKNL